MKLPNRHQQSGIAMLIVIMALLVVTAVATGMIIYSTSEVKVDANYRDEKVALFAAKAGLEEARDRMLASNANPIVLPTTLPGTIDGATYIYAAGATPWSTDTEFTSELTAAGLSLSGIPWYTSSASNTNYSGPSSNPVPYQWVRINLKTDGSAAPYSVDGVSGNKGQQVMFDSVTGHECVLATCPAGDSAQPVYELTSFAMTPNGTVRTLQDDVAAFSFNLNLKSPLSIPGTVGSFSGGNSNNYQIDGVDGQGSAPAISGCTANGAGGPAVSVSNSGSASTVKNGLPRPAHYTGNSCSYYSGGSGCIGNSTLPNTMGTPTQLEQTLQEIKQNANACVNCSGATGGSYSFSNIVSAMPGGTWPTSSDNPQIVYVNGDLDISSATGSGILVVTGNLNYNGASGWNGIILVVGQGTTTYNVNGGGNGEFNGAIFVATTRDATGNILANYGTSDFNINGGGGSGIFYNSCWINNVQKPVSYVVLSSKEISQ